MNNAETSIFLNDGAFIRWRGIWHVFQGPFQVVEYQNNQDFSICYETFYGQEPKTLKASKSLKMTPPEWSDFIKSEPLSHLRKWQTPNRELYTQSFNQIQKQIELKRWQKAVPIAFSESAGTFTVAERLSVLQALSQAPDSVMPYGFWSHGIGFIGASPEILYYKKANQLESMALAGTQKKTGEACHLLQDPKNLSEHQFVVDELAKKWKLFGDVQINPTEILEVPSLFHLLTQFKVQLKISVTDQNLVETLHPTSALGVFPHTLWKELAELPEQKTRDYFGAPVVYKLGADESLAVVALRQLQWDQKRARIGAGGGVVADSQEQLEWQEILAKMESVKKILKV